MKNHVPLLIALLTACTTAYASGGMEGGSERYAATNAKWRAECGACHVAFPARLLPAESWKTMMGGLDKHFGTDASVDAATSAEILAFLEKNASRRKLEHAAKPQLRITETRWFAGAHEEVPGRLWKDPRVKHASNCAACHTKADTGDFNEHNIRLPK